MKSFLQCLYAYGFLKCTVNGTAWDLQLDWSVATSQYFNTAYFVGYVITQLPGGFWPSDSPPQSKQSPHTYLRHFTSI